MTMTSGRSGKRRFRDGRRVDPAAVIVELIQQLTAKGRWRRDALRRQSNAPPENFTGNTG